MVGDCKKDWLEKIGWRLVEKDWLEIEKKIGWRLKKRLVLKRLVGKDWLEIEKKIGWRLVEKDW